MLGFTAFSANLRVANLRFGGFALRMAGGLEWPHPVHSRGHPYMQLDPLSGWCDGIAHCPSPNFNARPEGEVVSLLVIHNISLPPGQFGTRKVQEFFRNCLDPNEHPYFADICAMTVSAHFLIERDGSVFQFVSCNDRAWHAGVSRFDGRENCNDFSIGIELEGTDCDPYSDEQYAVLAELSRQLLSAYPGITPERIRGHCDIAPERKTDPGEAFDWVRYLAAVSHHKESQ